MNIDTTSTTFRRWLPALVGIIASLLISSFSVAYVTLAAPQRAVTVPSTVGFEGRLADSSGQPLDDGNCTVTFSLYGQATGGTALWDEEQTVTTYSGLYSTQLGTTTPLQPSDFDGPRWLGVKVGTEAEMTPRIPISSVPFALNAQEAAHAEEADQALGLQGRSVAATAPQDGQALIWSTSSNQWLPGTVATPQSIFTPTARVYNTVNVTIPASITTYIPFNSESWDNDNIHSTTANTTRLTAQTTGKYLIVGQAALPGVTSTPSLVIRLNGSTLIAVETSVTSEQRMDISTIYGLQTGDYVELGIYVAVGSWVYADSASPIFSLVKVSD